MAVDERTHSVGRDRRFYTWVAIAIPLIVLLGFARTYYLKGLFNGPALPGLLVHLHGLVMTSWVILFIVQVRLVATRRTNIHRRLGVLGGVLAGLVILIGITTAIAAAARGSSPGPPPLQFLVVPLGDMLLFATLVGTALYYRNRMEIHKRLMLIAAVNLLAPAIARIPLHFIEAGGPLAFFGLTDLCLLICVSYDTVKNRRLHPAFIWSVLLIIVSQPLRLMIAGTPTWLHFAGWLVKWA